MRLISTYFAACLLALATTGAAAQTTTFTYTGAPQAYTVPAGVTHLAVTAAGAAGGRVSTTQLRSLGAVVQANIIVVPGEVLTVVVGQRGTDGRPDVIYNGGGAGGFGAGGGGGSTDLRRGATATADYLTSRNALLVAGGAGGTDWLNSPQPQGGAGGTPAGGNGVGLSGNTPGQGATQFAVGGGVPGIGADGGTGGYGGGGGGYYGGGAAQVNGNSGGGGGGSSWVDSAVLLDAPVYSLDNAAGDGWLTITAAAPTPLPVVLTSFTGSVDAAGFATLRWATASEQHAQYFSVQRSLDGVTFMDAVTMPTMGTPTRGQNYQWPDPARLTQLTYYRLRETDLDGSSFYSSVVTFAPTASAERLVQVYPNPSHGQPVLLFLQGYSGQSLSLRLTDALGRVVYEQPLPALSNQYFTSLPTHLPLGSYVLTVSGGPKPVQKRLLISE